MCAFARTLSAPPGGVRPLVSGEAILLNDADDRLALPGGGGVRSEPSPGGVRELLLLGGVVLKVAEDGVATLQAEIANEQPAGADDYDDLIAHTRSAVRCCKPEERWLLVA